MEKEENKIKSLLNSIDEDNIKLEEIVNTLENEVKELRFSNKKKEIILHEIEQSYSNKDEK